MAANTVPRKRPPQGTIDPESTAAMIYISMMMMMPEMIMAAVRATVLREVAARHLSGQCGCGK